MEEADAGREGLTLDRIENVQDIPKLVVKRETETEPAGEAPASNAFADLLAALRSPAGLTVLIAGSFLVCCTFLVFLLRDVSGFGHLKHCCEIEAALGDQYRVRFRLRPPAAAPDIEALLTARTARLHDDLIVWGSRPSLQEALRRDDREVLGRFLADLLSEVIGRPLEDRDLEILDFREQSQEGAEDLGD